MPQQKRPQRKSATQIDVAGQVSTPTAAAISPAEDKPVAATKDSPDTPSPSSAGGVHASSSYHQPGRGLPAELIARILGSEDLERDDHARCTRVSRAFGKLAHDALYAHAMLSIEQPWDENEDCWGFLGSEGIKTWMRLLVLTVATATRSLQFRLCASGETGEQPAGSDDNDRYEIVYPDSDDDGEGYDERADHDRSFEREERMTDSWVDQSDTERLLASLPNLVHLGIHWQDHAFDYGETISLACPNLVDLTIEVLKAMPCLNYRQSTSIRRLVINAVDSRLNVSRAKEYLETMTPPSLVSLSMPLSSTSAALLLSFLEENLTRLTAFRTVRLRGDSRGPQWALADRQALKALGEKHGFRVYLPGEGEA